jgi:hypothetical protein
VYESILPPGTPEVAAVLARWSGMTQFYLSGGTALALHLGHRQSRDLDFFTREVRRTLPPLGGMEGAFKPFQAVVWNLRSPDQIQAHLDGVSVTWLAYPFPHRFPYHTWRGLAVADPRDIVVQKAYTLGRRARALGLARRAHPGAS